MSEPNRQYHQALSANRKLLDENARLKAEVERLTEAHSDALADFWAIHKGYFDLKAEVERLRASSFVTAVPVEEYEKLKAEVERLTMIKDACKRMIKRRDKWIFERKAEVERLRKAGDAMLLALWLGVNEYSKEQKEKAEEEWNAANREQGCLVNPIKVAQYLPKPPAKEGKQP